MLIAYPYYDRQVQPGGGDQSPGAGAVPAERAPRPRGPCDHHQQTSHPDIPPGEVMCVLHMIYELI